MHPHGRCSEALARLAPGASVQARGPIATDEPLHTALGLRSPSRSATAPHPSGVAAVHCLSGGSGIAPMYQIADTLLSRAEDGQGTRRGEGEGEAAMGTIRLWSFNRRLADIVLPAQVAALQHRGIQVHLPVLCTNVLTREPPSEAVASSTTAASHELTAGATASDGSCDPCDPSARFGGRSIVLRGRPELQALLEGVPASEVAAAALVICGPDGFNEAMRQAAHEVGYQHERVFVRHTPRNDHSQGEEC